MENEVNAVQNGGNENVVTPTTQEAVNQDAGSVAQASPVQPEKTFTKQQVIDIMKKRVERSHNSFFNRYGVKDLNGLDELFGKTKKFDEMSNQYGAIQLQNAELLQENSFLKNNINPDKYNDIKAYFKGSGLEFTNENLVNALATHPEWLKPSNIPATTTISSVGAEAHMQPQVNEKDVASKLFGVKL